MQSTRCTIVKNSSVALMVGLMLTLGPVTSLAASDLNDHRVAIGGSRISAGEAAQLEKTLAERPDDYSARVQLLGYYFLQHSVAARETRTKHVMWMIQNHPGAKLAGSPYSTLNPIRDAGSYERAKDLWLQQIEFHAHDPQILGNAARFFLISDRERAEDLLKEAQSLDPANPEWAQQLGHLYALDTNSKSAQSRKERAGQSVEQLEAALAVADGARRRAMLPQAAKAAFEAGDFDSARSYAVELVEATDETSWNHGNAVHHGNLILGRLALKSGDVELAKLHLIEAGKTTGSPQLNSFGPNMTLAKELLEREERKSVLEYIALCGKFWSEHDQLEAWAGEVEAGRIPHFGANLSY